MDDNSTSTTTEPKKRRSSRGRQRIEIKKLEDESKRQVTFSKRRKVLFNKAKELSTLCGADVGIITLSKSGKAYTTDDVYAVLDRFLGRSSGPVNQSLLKRKQAAEGDDINGGYWLEQRIENLGLVELLEYAEALKELRENAAARMEELSTQNSDCFLSMVNDDQDVIKAEFLHLQVEENYDWCL